MELGGLGDGFTINMSRLAALPRFSASFSTELSRFYFERNDSASDRKSRRGILPLSIKIKSLEGSWLC
jgi:hypothetical protein